MSSFVHLRVHSEYSLSDGLVRIKPLLARTVELGMPAVALTDRDNLFALIKFYRAAEAAGVKPLAGVDLGIVDDAGDTSRVLALIVDVGGYRNLTRLVSDAWVSDDTPRGRISRKALLEHNAGLIVLSGGLEGDVAHALCNDRPDRAAQLLDEWQSAFGDRYYLEVQRTQRPDEERYLHGVVDLAARHDCAVVATNDVVFLDADDFEAHEVRVCVAESRTLDDPRRQRRYSETQYLRSPAEMAELWSDLPEALENTVEIARRCNLTLELGNYALPQYPLPEGQDADTYFELESRRGLEARLVQLGISAADKRAEYTSRLDLELGVIRQMGFAGYFLIVMEFIKWARENRIPVGPGRGSGAGSLVAYSLGITDLDPLAYDLLFERFLNPERVSMPDFDVDFCMEGRDAVISHVAELYGHDAVSQIITYGTMAAKAVVRDVARVQGKPYGLADRLSKLIPFEVGMTLSKAMAQEAELVEFVEQNEDAAEIMEMAYKLEGVVRNVGRHAGGVVIAPGQLTDFVPLYCEEGSDALVTQFDKDDVESAGLVKFDFLGLRTLTIIDWAVANVNALNAELGVAPIDIDTIDLADPVVFDLLKRAETTAVFQLESRGMKDLIRRLQPDSLEDVIALVALFRPGPLQSGMVDDFIDRKHGRARVEYPHPDLEPVLKNTYGVILYQEQVMQIAQVLAGFTLGGADVLRRAMGKKKAEEMALQRQIFADGAAERGVDPGTATHIFDLMEKFAGYGFNKSHSAAYALVSYQTAWLKAHHPAAFMAAVLSADMQNTDKIVTLVDECRDMGLTVRSPNVNQGMYRFTVDASTHGDGADASRTIIYGLGAIKGVGEGPIEALVEERNRGGAFADLLDFCQRVDARRANRRVVEALIKSGAMDCLAEGEPDLVRPNLLDQLPDALQIAEQQARNSEAGMQDLFGMGVETAALTVHARPPVAAYTLPDRLAAEKETLGLYLTGHPIETYADEIARFTSARIADLEARNHDQVVAGMVVNVRYMRTRRGDTLAFVVLDDRSGRIEVSVFGDVLEGRRDVIARDEVLVVEGEVSPDDYSGALRVRASAIHDIAGARARFADRLIVGIHGARCQGRVDEQLSAILAGHRRAGCRVAVDYASENARARLVLGEEWQVRPSDELLNALRSAFGSDGVYLDYRRATLH